MILAHLPAGYLLSRAVGARGRLAVGAALLGSFLPDLDLIWFYLVDDAAVHHHRYWVHGPGFWGMAAAAILPAVTWVLGPRFLRAAMLFLASILIHLLLDSIGGGIMWLWPLNTTLYSLVTIPATRSHWVLSFLTHWSFAVEIAIIASAGVLLWNRKQSLR